MQIYPYPQILDKIPLNEHAVIEASAGTGKTYTIEHLVVDRLLRTPVNIHQILVVTFTDKATSELRKRIRDLIENILRSAENVSDIELEKENPLLDQRVIYQGKTYWKIDIDAQRKLEQTLFSFDQAAIYTIHAFCRKILVDLAFDSGQLFEQELIEGKRAFHDAWQKTIRYEIAQNPMYKQAIEQWLAHKEDLYSLERLLFEAYKLGYLQNQKSFGHEITSVMKRLINDWDTDLMKSSYEQSAIQNESKTEAIQCIEQIAELFELPIHIEQKFKQLISLKLIALIQPKKTGSKQKKKFFDDYEPKIRDTIRRLDQLRLLSEMESSLERKTVDELLPIVVNHLTIDKRKEGQLDYDDLLRCVWQSLNSIQAQYLIEALRFRFRYALIDEFQDTDPLQWKIFKKVFVDQKSAEHAIYIIGDPKQAIYTFRGADVHTYLNARYELTKAGAPRVPLTMNYRSTQKMINAVNMILDQKAEHPIFQGQIKYDEPVGCGKKSLKLINHLGQEVPAITLWRFKPPPPSQNQRIEISSYQLKQAYLAHLSESIKALLNPNTPLYLQDGQESRVLGANDILILVRENKEALEVASTLRSLDIPYSLYKPEGLLQGKEALQIYDMLNAIVHPHDKGLRLKAFTTPFIGIDWFHINFYATLPPGHPILVRLFDYHQLAQQGKYSTLFYKLLYQSGLSERELFFGESEREITNYQHIFEVLLQITSRHRCTPAELLLLLHRFMQGLESPPSSDDNIQRLFSDRQMVQIMTIHKSKGLEAPIVCMYGGFSSANEQEVNIVQDADEGRKVLIGNQARQSIAQRIAEEQKQEDQRLLYVALTRAQAKLMMPFIDSSRKVKGSYHPLKERIKAIADAQAFSSDFEVLELKSNLIKDGFSLASVKIMDWKPNDQLLMKSDQSKENKEILIKHQPLQITSYTRLKQEKAGKFMSYLELNKDEFFVDQLNRAEEVEGDEEELPGGRQIGQFLHSVVEEIDFNTFKKGHFEDWSVQNTVIQKFEELMRKYDIALKWMRASQLLIYYTLTTPIKLKHLKLPAFAKMNQYLLEMEFLYPIPENTHPKLVDDFVFQLNLSKNIYEQTKPFSVERGFVKGFIDFVFEHQGQVYFLDWKSDQCASYDDQSLARHVAIHYDLQAKLYMIAILRWLNIKTQEQYDQRFGGFIYVFFRAFHKQDHQGGIYYEKPSWAEVLTYENILSQLIQSEQISLGQDRDISFKSY